MIKIGYKASAEQFSPSELLSLVCQAETLGFDSAFISDHFQPWKHTNGHAPFSLSWLGAVGAKTSNIILGTSVLTPTFRYHPSLVAQAFATLACLFPQRIILGIGSGESLNEVPATAMAWPEMKIRFARMREAVALIRQLWSEDRVSFNGEFYQTQSATIYDRPEHEVPIYIAAAGPMVAKYAGRVGDGFICTSGKDPSLYQDQLLPNVKAGLSASTNPNRSFDMMIEMKVSFDTDLKQALENTRLWGALALSAEEKMSVEDPIEMEKLADALSTERTAKRWIVSTDPDEHVERIKAYVDLGFNHLVFHAPGADQQRFLKLYSELVIPRIHKQWG